MFNLILKLKLFLRKLFLKKKININIFFNKNYKFGDITIILPFNKKKNLYNKLCKIIMLNFKYYFFKYKIKNNYLNFYLNNFFFLKIINYLINKKFNIKKLIFNKKNLKKLIIIEFSSPNSNKPLHIGHLRNILIGDTLSNIYKNLGFYIIKSQIINDRGLHICKTIISFKLFYNKINPLFLIKKKIKGDHYVGKLYYKFENKLNNELKYLLKKYKKKEVIQKSKLLKYINKELIKWENNNKKTLFFWKIIRYLVLKGFKKTYKKLNIKFNETIYESDIYLIGKKIIKKGIKKKIFFLDKKNRFIYLNKKGKKIILLRNNGTSLYLTQDIGSIYFRFKKYNNINLLIYVVGNEQIFHFKILFEIIKKLKLLKIKKLYHLYYNTVNYLGKKIKSRYNNKNKIIFIDNLIKVVYKYTKKKLNFKKKILKKITIGTIKYQFLKNNLNKIINFNLKNSLNINNNTYIYIQYTYVRIYSIIKKIKKNDIFIIKKLNNNIKFNIYEKDIIINIINYNNILKKCIKNKDITILTKYIYILSKKINFFYQNNKILVNNIEKKNLKLSICKIILNTLFNIMKILNIPILKKI
ncbi:MAG: arginine--tRNA ligase [Candidatus Shikimatogenerans sp. JK-2022]|nr:arginine--tRNA ligase [Candidatus Shikimatogenerans bostrichidophilus]